MSFIYWQNESKSKHRCDKRLFISTTSSRSHRFSFVKFLASSLESLAWRNFFSFPRAFSLFRESLAIRVDWTEINILEVLWNILFLVITRSDNSLGKLNFSGSQEIIQEIHVLIESRRASAEKTSDVSESGKSLQCVYFVFCGKIFINFYVIFKWHQRNSGAWNVNIYPNYPCHKRQTPPTSLNYNILKFHNK